MLKFSQNINTQIKERNSQGQLMIKYIQKGELKKLRQLVADMSGPDNIDFTSISGFKMTLKIDDQMEI